MTIECSVLKRTSISACPRLRDHPREEVGRGEKLVAGEWCLLWDVSGYDKAAVFTNLLQQVSPTQGLDTI